MAGIDELLKFAQEKLKPLLEAEVRLLGGLPKEIEAINEELTSIKSYLAKAEVVADEDEDTKNRVKEVRRIMYKLEDIVDDYQLLRQRRQYQVQTTTNTADLCNLVMVEIWRCLQGAVQWVMQQKPKHDIASTIEQIKEEIQKIKGSSESYHAAADPEIPYKGQERKMDPWSFFKDRDDPVGITGPKKEMVQRLDLEEQTADKKRRFVAVKGVPGAGKTTLVEKVYKDRDVRVHFPLFAWVTVSQSYDPLFVLNNIFKQFDEDASKVASSEVNVTALINQLREYLDEQRLLHKRFIVVLDDVWDTGLLPYIRDALAFNSNGPENRIMLTTRIESVAESWATFLQGQVYKLEPLSPDDAWQLFCRKLFGQNHCPHSELEHLSHDILGKCQGIPLAIVTVIGVLSTKRKVIPAWRKVRDNLGSQLRNSPLYESTKRIILYSYHELPYQLKPCFLYLGMFPEDYSVEVSRLVRIWVAEGLIESVKDQTLEEVGEEYVDELAQRGLIQIIPKDGLDFPDLPTVKVHDVLHEIILSKLEDLNFCQVMSKDNLTMNGQFRRLSIHNISSIYNNASELVSKRCSVRSILSFGLQRFPSSLLVSSSLLEVASGLRVLDLGGAPIDHLPREVVKLQQLRFLNLRYCENIRKLPESMGQLFNLETLYLSFTSVSKLPRGISQLHKLRHLLLDIKFPPFGSTGTEIPEGVLGNLEALHTLEFECKKEALLKELINLKHLRWLSISILRNEDNGTAFCRALDVMPELRCLCVWLRGGRGDNDKFLDLGRVTSPPLKLEKLILWGHLLVLPPWMGKLTNLVDLTFAHSCLKDGALQPVQQLESLERLFLHVAFRGDHHFDYTGFQNLRQLCIQRASLSSLTVPLPRLEKLELELMWGECGYWNLPPHLYPAAGIETPDDPRLKRRPDAATETQQ